MKKEIWSKDVWFCKAEYLSAKDTAARYQRCWLLIQDPWEIIFQWYSDGISAQIEEYKKLYDQLYPEEDYEEHIEYHQRFIKSAIILSPKFRALIELDKKQNELNKIKSKFALKEMEERIDRKTE